MENNMTEKEFCNFLRITLNNRYPENEEVTIMKRNNKISIEITYISEDKIENIT